MIYRLTAPLLLLALLATLLVGCDSSSSDADGSQPLIPLSDGNSWVMASGSGTDTTQVTLTIDGTTTVDGGEYQRIMLASRFGTAEAPFVIRQKENSIYVGIVRTGSQPVLRGFELRTDVGDGDVYTHRDETGRLYEVRVLGAQPVSVPAGDFEGIGYRVTDVERSDAWTSVIIPGVGPARIESINGTANLVEANVR
jgi:hypothetical protein